MSGFNYLICFGGGVGPDVWDAEAEVGAVDIFDAVNLAKRYQEDGGWVFSIQQNDYPLTKREQLESELAEAKAQNFALAADNEKLRRAMDNALPLLKHYNGSKYLSEALASQPDTDLGHE